jgi:diphthamide biosynthesis protein 3
VSFFPSAVGAVLHLEYKEINSNKAPSKNMPLYEEVEIEDFSFDPKTGEYTYPCPCGDIFKVTLEELWDGEDIARCPSCTLFVQIIYDEDDLPALPEDQDDDEEEGGEKGDAKDEGEEAEGQDSVLKNTSGEETATRIAGEMMAKLNMSSPSQ